MNHRDINDFRLIPLSVFFALLIMLSFSFSDAQAQTTPQIWTYDFGDEVGVYNSGESVNPTLLPDTQDGGGDTKLRIGEGNEIILSNNLNEIGTFSKMIIEGMPSTTGGYNSFHIGGFESSNLFYARVNIKISVDEVTGESDFYILLDDEDGFDGNAVRNASNLGGLRFRVQADGEVETAIRRDQNWNITSQFGTGLILLEDENIIEIYFNNSGLQQTYNRNGLSRDLDIDRYAVYVNGNRIQAVFSDDAEVNSDLVSNDISVLRFTGGQTEGDQAQIEIDDIVYSNSLPDVRSIEGTEGWRMLASPMDGFDVGQLARQNMVQGVTGNDYETSPTNIYTGYDGVDFTTANDFDTTLDRGEGFIWYLYDNANVLESKPLPFDLAAASNQTVGDVSVDLHNDGNNFNLVGNPFSTGLDVSDIGNWTTDGTLESVVVQTWDANAGSYVQPQNDIISSFQGFFVENSDATSLTIPESAQADEEVFFKDNSDRRIIAFEVEGSQDGQPYVDKSFRLYFSEGAQQGWDVRDATKLYPLTESFVGIAFEGELNGEPVLKAQDSRPLDLTSTLSIPVNFYSVAVDGEITLSVNSMTNIPEGWKVEIEDTYTGAVQALDLENSYTFIHQAGKSPTKIAGSNSLAAPKVADSTPLCNACYP
ncbi:MAG: hypothetical protein WEA58_07195 [Balneolaceae bacterium]